MKQGMKIIFGALLGVLLLGVPVRSASADAVVSGEDTSYDRYIAFGQDLKASEKQKVLQQFGINESDLSDYKTIEITNQEEHDYLGDYIDAKVIGSRALSSVMIVKTEKGSGIQVETKNITYCTSGMYCNALVTAGLEDAQVTVVGPFGISGTSALVGAMKAYSVMTGKDISESTMDAATDELVTPAELADSIGDSEKVAQLVAAVVDTEGLSEKVGGFFSNIFDAIKDFFTGLFG